MMKNTNGGRPSKAEKKQQEQIEETKAFKRDAFMYTEFTDTDIKKATEWFCLQCDARNNKNNSFMNQLDERIEKQEGIKDNFKTPELYSKYKQLLLIDEDIAEYFKKINLRIYNSILKNRERPKYIVSNLFNINNFIKEALGESRHSELNKNIVLEGIFLEAMQRKYWYEIYFELLTKEDKNKILTYMDTFKNVRLDRTEINYVGRSTISDMSKNKFVHVELDLTRPIDEIQEYIKVLQNDYCNNLNNFKNAYELLGVKIPLHKKDKEKCSIEVTHSKPLIGKLADILFIYDCRNVGLNNKYIIDGIDIYWQDTKKHSTDGFYDISNYLNIAKSFIDEEKYINYMNGVKDIDIEDFIN